jgi:hypothetical protein
MNENLKKAFNNIKYQSEQDLSEKVWHSIIKHEKRISYVKLYTFSLFGILSLVGMIPAFKMLFADFSQSGFYEYFSLLFSSNGALASSWKELAYSLAESLPTISIIFSFTILFVFFLSLRYVLKQIVKGQLSLSFRV